MGYLSLNSAELTALNGLPSLYFQLYIIGLRAAMDYKTGTVGENENGLISWQTLVDKLTPKRHKGGLYIAPTISQIKRGINELEKRNLVVRKSNKTHLIFYLKSAIINDPLNSPLNDPLVAARIADTARTPANDEIKKRPPKRQGNDPNLIIINKKKTNTTNVVLSKEKLKRRIQLPKDFAVKESHVEFSEANGFPHPEVEIDAFKDYHQARGTVMLDWDRAFYTWLRNAKRWNGGKGYARNAASQGVRTKSSVESFWEFFGSESNTNAAFNSETTCTGSEIAV